MTVSKVLLSAVIALAFVPAAAQAATASAPARALSISPAASSLSISNSVRVGARGNKKSHAFIALLGLPALLGLGVVTAVAITAAAGGFSSNSSGG
jgi:hypothetical protein